MENFPVEFWNGVISLWGCAMLIIQNELDLASKITKVNAMKLV